MNIIKKWLAQREKQKIDKEIADYFEFTKPVRDANGLLKCAVRVNPNEVRPPFVGWDKE